jgi:hypothetical protein
LILQTCSHQSHEDKAESRKQKWGSSLLTGFCSPGLSTFSISAFCFCLR